MNSSIYLHKGSRNSYQYTRTVRILWDKKELYWFVRITHDGS